MMKKRTNKRPLFCFIQIFIKKLGLNGFNKKNIKRRNK